MTSESRSLNSASTLPRIGIPSVLRLSLFQMGLGIMSVLTLAVINRVMISELAIPASITAAAIALPQLLASPAKVRFGQLSDARPLFGYHRSGYIWLGTLFLGVFVFLSVQVVWQLGSAVREAGGWVWNAETSLWTIVLGAVFVFYGLAVNASSVPFATLLVDVSEEEQRSKIISISWSFLMVGIVAGAVFGSQFLERIQPEGIVKGANVGALLSTGEKAMPTAIAQLQGPINTLFIVVPALVFVLALVATVGIEGKYSRYRERSQLRQEELTLGRALQVLLSSRQTGIFFIFLLVMTLGLFMQEAVLEPYGGEVFNLSIADTTRLNAFWGMGILLGLSFSGFVLASRLGKLQTARWGCLLVAACFVLIILAGFTGIPNLLRGSVFLFGLAAGVTTTGGISLMLDLTAAETAGTFIGAWGLSQGIARGFATVAGGAMLDLGKYLFASTVLAYGLVFATQAVLMLVAIGLLDRVSVKEFRSSTQAAISMVMEGDIEG